MIIHGNSHFLSNEAGVTIISFHPNSFYNKERRMELHLSSSNQGQQKFDFGDVLYQTLTVMLPDKEIAIDIQTGQVIDQPIDRTDEIATLDFVDRYQRYQQRRGLSDNTIASCRSVLVALAAQAPIWPPTVDEVEALLDGYHTKKYSRVTLAEYWGRLNTWFDWALKRGYLRQNPMLQVDRRGMPKAMTPDVTRSQDFIKVIRCLHDVMADTEPRQRSLPYERAIRDLAIIRFAYATGCRAGEVAKLRLRDLDLDQRVALLRSETTTNAKQREVYFGRQAHQGLEEWLDIRPEIGNQLFVGVRGNGWAKQPMTGAGVYHAWQAWQALAGIGPYKFHEIRHSHVTHSLDNGIPIHHVSRQAGHSSPDITLRIYTHSKDPERQQAYTDKNPDDQLAV
jgi:integrase